MITSFTLLLPDMPRPTKLEFSNFTLDLVSSVINRKHER